MRSISHSAARSRPVRYTPARLGAAKFSDATPRFSFAYKPHEEYTLYIHPLVHSIDTTARHRSNSLFTMVLTLLSTTHGLISPFLIRKGASLITRRGPFGLP